MEEGKLAPERLQELLAETSRGPEVIIGAELGEDAAVVVGRERMVITTDPITFTEENIGIYTVAVNCNDIVAMGGRPLYLTTTILLPPGTTEARVGELFREISAACRQAGVYWVGGHTEVTSAVTRVVVSATAVGFLEREEPTSTSAARPGQVGGAHQVGRPGGHHAASPASARPRRGACSARSRYREVLGLAAEAGHLHPRGGARAGRRCRWARPTTRPRAGWPPACTRSPSAPGSACASGGERIPVREETRLLCAHFGLDPLGALSSGVLLFTAAPEAAGEACRLLQAAGVPAVAIGEVTAAAGQVLLDGVPLPAFARDEVLKVFAGGRPAAGRRPS